MSSMTRSGMSAMPPPPITAKQSLKITPNQHKTLARLARRQSLADPISKEDFLDLAAALKAGLETVDIVRLRFGILRWIHGNSQLFGAWFFEIREVYPYFFDVLLKPPPSRCHCRRRGIKPGACRPTVNPRRHAPTRGGEGNAPEYFPGMYDPIPEHFILPDLPALQGEGTGELAYPGSMFTAPLLMEPEAFCGPPRKHPWNASGAEEANTSPSLTHLIPAERVPSGTLLPEPALPQPPRRRSVPILRRPVPSRFGAASNGVQDDWQVLERNSVMRVDSLLKDETVVASGGLVKAWW